MQPKKITVTSFDKVNSLKEAILVVSCFNPVFLSKVKSFQDSRTGRTGKIALDFLLSFLCSCVSVQSEKFSRQEDRK